MITKFILPLIASSLCALSPTYEHLRHCKIDLPEDLKEEVYKKSHIIDKVLKEEKKRAEEYYVFYHAGSNLFVYQEVLEHLLGQQKRYHWLRHPNHETFGSVGDLFESYDTIDDEDPIIRSSLLSVNLSLFGNTEDMDCCTLAYWLLGHRAEHWYEPKEILKETLELSGHSLKGLDLLTDLYRETNERSLLQIFVPKSQKERLEECFYLSHDRGEPCEHSEGASFEHSLLHCPKAQGRLLINSRLLLDPDSGIEINRYILVDEESKIKIAKEKIASIGQKNTLNL